MEDKKNLEEISMKLKTLDVKDKLLVILSDAKVTLNALASIRASVKSMGGLGVLFLPDVKDIRAGTIDSCIEQLKTMKDQLIPPSTKGIMTEPDEN
jgi:hypothetical protein